MHSLRVLIEILITMEVAKIFACVIIFKVKLFIDVVMVHCLNDTLPFIHVIKKTMKYLGYKKGKVMVYIGTLCIKIITVCSGCTKIVLYNERVSK